MNIYFPGQVDAVRYLLTQIDVPVAPFALSGELAITKIIQNIPDSLALQALDQFIYYDLPVNKTRYYLGNMACKRHKKLLLARNLFSSSTSVKGPLEV